MKNPDFDDLSFLFAGCVKIDAIINMIMIYYWDKCKGGHLEHVW